MNGSSNLPPGVTESMIPGNRPEDIAWEKLLDEIGDSGLDHDEARARWESQPDLLALCKDIRKIYTNCLSMADMEKLDEAIASATVKPICDEPEGDYNQYEDREE